MDSKSVYMAQAKYVVNVEIVIVIAISLKDQAANYVDISTVQNTGEITFSTNVIEDLNEMLRGSLNTLSESINRCGSTSSFKRLAIQHRLVLLRDPSASENGFYLEVNKVGVISMMESEVTLFFKLECEMDPRSSTCIALMDLPGNVLTISSRAQFLHVIQILNHRHKHRQ